MIETNEDNGWIDPKDRLPAYGERVLVLLGEAWYSERPSYEAVVFQKNDHGIYWEHDNVHIYLNCVEFWQHLPKPPAEYMV